MTAPGVFVQLEASEPTLVLSNPDQGSLFSGNTNTAGYQCSYAQQTCISSTQFDLDPALPIYDSLSQCQAVCGSRAPLKRDFK